MQTEVLLPVYKLEYSRDLISVFRELGINNIFTGECDLSKITSDKINVSQFIHKTFIECNQYGTEATAFTGAVMNRCMPKMLEKRKFVADKPFSYFIVDKSVDLIIFSGIFYRA